MEDNNKRTNTVIKVIIFVLWILVGIYTIIMRPTRFTYGCCWVVLLFELFCNIIKD